MITLSLLICLIGLAVWVLLSIYRNQPDPPARPSALPSLLAEAGRLAFFSGLLAYLLNVGMKTL